MIENNKVSILNMNFDSIRAKELLNIISERVNHAEKTFVVTANPEIVMHGRNDETYLNLVNQANFVIADGYGVILGSKMIQNELPERIAGFDLMNSLLEKGNQEGWSVYFLGAKEEVISKAVHNIKGSFPSLKIAGWHNGYTDVNEEGFVEAIASKKPDLVFVGIGFPKQEYWISTHMSRFEKGFFMGVGGSFDVWAGVVKRAPMIWQNLHMEWLYRLIKQPKRWKRMLVIPDFVLNVMKERFRK